MITVDGPGTEGNAPMPERVKRPNPWRMMMMILTFDNTVDQGHQKYKTEN
jgi:hypothetical protein